MLLQSRPAPGAFGAGRLGSSPGFGGKNLTAVGLEQVRKVADDFCKELHDARAQVELHKGEAEAAKVLCTKLDDRFEREQDKNAKLIAKVKGAEKNMQDILGQIEGVKAMHNVLLESLGEANETIQRVDQKREVLSDAFDDRFKLCQELTGNMEAIKTKQIEELQQHIHQMHATEDALASLQKETEAKATMITDLTTQLQQLQVSMADQAHGFRTEATLLQATNSTQGRQIEELHAEIKHAFADLERNEAARLGLETKTEDLRDQLDDAMQHIEHLKENLTAKAAELEEAHSAHKQAQEALEHSITGREESLQNLTSQLTKLEATRADEQGKHEEEVAKLNQQMLSRQEAWAAEKAKMDSIAREADKKHQQLADRTALELEKLQASAKQDVAAAQAQVKDLKTELKHVGDELDIVKQEKAELLAGHQAEAAQFSTQLSKDRQQKEQLTEQLNELRREHDAAVSKAKKDLAAKLEELNDMRKSRDSAAAMTVKEKETVEQLSTEITALRSKQEALNTEHERSAKESSEAVQRSLAMQKAQSEAEIGVMKNRLEHEKAMSEQRQEATAAMIDSLHAELAERGAIIAHLQEELQQKEHLLQQISMAAAPVPPTALAVAPSPKRPTPGKGARLPRHTPQRVMDGPKPALHPQKPALGHEGYSDESEGPHLGAAPQMDFTPGNDEVGDAAMTVPIRKHPNKSPRKPARQGIKAQESQQVAYEEQLPFLSQADLLTEDERNYVMPQRRQARRPSKKGHRAHDKRAEAMAALAITASKKNSIFSTMSARSLGSDDEGAASYGAVNEAPPGYGSGSAGRFARQPHTRKRSRLFGTAATDIFGKACMDPYSFGV
ncbi:hypothetical protein CVIRNUC_007500 [Coccomyxa viridis]|uniref:Uncharacterized protein n=1 Tax=Coccomyxa viridis TaxID=1274662 RepID=A0AAV1IC36_9CHLO|nr:hypothetical protein CVIRNUC_007500 [Coccomyxa viridis]